MTVVRHWHRLPRVAVAVSSLEGCSRLEELPGHCSKSEHPREEWGACGRGTVKQPLLGCSNSHIPALACLPLPHPIALVPIPLPGAGGQDRALGHTQSLIVMAAELFCSSMFSLHIQD